MRRVAHITHITHAGLLSLLIGLTACKRGRDAAAPPTADERSWIFQETGDSIPYARELELYTPDPPYAEVAESPMLRRGAPVHVKIDFCVDPRGTVDAVELARSSGEEYLDGVFVRTIQRWRFHPIERDGTPERACTYIEFKMTPKTSR